MNEYIIIPAKGGSRGLESKNMQQIGPGLTLLEKCVRTCLEVLDGDRIFVSSNDLSILELAGILGVGHRWRADLFCSPTASSESVIIDWLSHNPICNGSDKIAMVQCTCPFLTAFDIKRCLNGTGFISREVKVHTPDPWQVRKPRQKSEPLVQDVGSCYVNTADGWLANGRFCNYGGTRNVPHEHPYGWLDIDSAEDLELARMIYESDRDQEVIYEWEI